MRSSRLLSILMLLQLRGQLAGGELVAGLEQHQDRQEAAGAHDRTLGAAADNR